MDNNTKFRVKVVKTVTRFYVATVEVEAADEDDACTEAESLVIDEHGDGDSIAWEEFWRDGDTPTVQVEAEIED